jgi:hypothetical protein
MMAATLTALEPGRTFTLDGRSGAPPRLQPRQMPKIRDRLTILLDETNVVPALDDTVVRQELAAGLGMSRLYALDDLYTDMAIAAATSLRTASIAALDVPAPFGLLTWDHPVDDDGTIAMSWTTDENLIHAVAYCALGTTIDGAQLQRLREQAGWLLPTGWATLYPEYGIDRPPRRAAARLLAAHQASALRGNRCRRRSWHS